MNRLRAGQHRGRPLQERPGITQAAKEEPPPGPGSLRLPPCSRQPPQRVALAGPWLRGRNTLPAAAGGVGALLGDAGALAAGAARARNASLPPGNGFC